MSNPVAAVLKDARALVEGRWVGYWPLGADPDLQSHCCITAMVAAAHRRGVADCLPAAAIFRKTIDATYISEWNDAPGRTEADVLAAFDRAITLAEQEAQ